MRKTVIALILILPLLFVFSVFAGGNIASLGVDVSARGIQILEKPQNSTLTVDLATYKNDYKLQAQVLPSRATDKKYSYKVEPVAQSDFAAVTVDDDGIIKVSSPGQAKVSVVSNDGGFSDSINLIVSSSKPYSLEYQMTSFATGEEVAFEKTAQGYTATLTSGDYRYSLKTTPSFFPGATTTIEDGFALLSEDKNKILLPFSGRVDISTAIADGVFGDIKNDIMLDVQKTVTQSGFTINGGKGGVVALDQQATSATIYVEASQMPTFSHNNNIQDVKVSAIEGREGCYKVDVTFKEDKEDYIILQVTVDGKSDEVAFSFSPFAFSLTTELPVQTSNSASILVGSQVKFYASPSSEVKNVSYQWEASQSTAGEIDIQPNADGSNAKISASATGEFLLTVKVFQNGRQLDVLPAQMTVYVVRQLSGLSISTDQQPDLGASIAVAGKRFDGGDVVDNAYKISVTAYNGDALDGIDDVQFVLSQPQMAQLEVENDGVKIKPLAKGKVTLTASWLGNDSFGANVTSSILLRLDNQAVEVENSDQLFYATENQYPVVLTKDIMLGEDATAVDAQGKPKVQDNLQSKIKQTPSTFNTHFYTSQGNGDQAVINYLIKFDADVYGNGHYINADHFTTNTDLFKGPLFFVSMGELASVAGQDNVSFLMYKNGVTLYDVSLFGCSDDSLLDAQSGQSDLNKLNTVGTVLDINASVNILNCRVSNGRNVVRVYGGNQQGDHYFIDSLADNYGCDGERINVKIEGCVLAMAREFVLKIGANRALRASDSDQPPLTDANGNQLTAQANNLMQDGEDGYFYRMYVLTDLTVKDSVIEKSGLFCVGVESNFCGNFLCPDGGLSVPGWQGAGGTSFASVLRLEGDVRLLDWKKINLVDSSTLIEVNATGDDLGSVILNALRLNIGAMLEFVQAEGHPDIITEIDGEKYVHGGIAYYGGGHNYGQLDLSKLDSNLQKGLTEYLINISILAGSEDADLQKQGLFLPMAAGTDDFRFYLYNSSSPNSYQKQQSSSKYDGIKAL